MASGVGKVKLSTLERVLVPSAKRLFCQLKQLPLMKNWYLAGGTALALQYGHRRSVDFDWFSPRSFSINKLELSLRQLGRLKVLATDIGTWHGALNGVKISFLYYPYPLLYPCLNYGWVRLANDKDIACMKLQAISSRGSRKDFFDFYTILKRYSLAEILHWVDRKFQGVKYSHLHLLKSLVYFNDAESEPNPVLLDRLNWTRVKTELRKQVKLYLSST